MAETLSELSLRTQSYLFILAILSTIHFPETSFKMIFVEGMGKNNILVISLQTLAALMQVSTAEHTSTVHRSLTKPAWEIMKRLSGTPPKPFSMLLWSLPIFQYAWYNDLCHIKMWEKQHSLVGEFITSRSNFLTFVILHDNRKQ